MLFQVELSIPREGGRLGGTIQTVDGVSCRNFVSFGGEG